MGPQLRNGECMHFASAMDFRNETANTMHIAHFRSFLRRRSFAETKSIVHRTHHRSRLLFWHSASERERVRAFANLQWIGRQFNVFRLYDKNVWQAAMAKCASARHPTKPKRWLDGWLAGWLLKFTINLQFFFSCFQFYFSLLFSLFLLFSLRFGFIVSILVPMWP